MKNKISFSDLKKSASKYLSEDSINFIKKAYDFSKKAHKGQYRISEQDYITHPLSVAKILAELEQDPVTIAASLLHDTIEDSEVTPEKIKETFGEDICTLVEGVTKLGQIYFGSKQEREVENLRKMFLAMAEDLRVVIIKLADRLHNMRTLNFLPPERQLKIARETRDIFSPLAHRLGMWSLKWELEDLAFYYLQKNEFQRIKKLISSKREEREEYVNNFIEKIQALLKQNKMPAEITGRPKHFYSIYLKLQKQDINFDELYDTLGVRIILDSVMECYKVLGIIHSAFKPISGRIKDYIAMAKSNLYQSLHTTVIGPEGKPIEIQIRTLEMHQIAENGIAAHWRYKEGEKKKHYDGDFFWLKQILELQQEKVAPEDFLQSLKLDLFIDEVFVFTPRGDVQVLPKGATPIDFAYKIHTEVGHRCIGAKINNHIAPLSYKLKNGDRVDILTSNKENPNLNWLSFIQSSHAKSKLKQWFRKKQAANNIERGKNLLEKALIVSGYLPRETLIQDNLDLFYARFNTNKYPDLYMQISLGDISVQEVTKFLDKKFKKPEPKHSEEILKGIKTTKTKAKSISNIRVLGEENVLVKFANCCAPLPGDDIIGFISLGYGVSIHRTDCKNIINLPEKDKVRLVQVDWNEKQKSNQTYPIHLEIEAFDRIGLLQDILAIITENKLNIIKLNSRKIKKVGFEKIDITLDILNTEQLNKIKNAISKISDVYSIRRVQK
jgi:GTP diphosphokinase / guanosine-3',5'-bis(diphosphate) 3'-diphosphatase